MLTVCVCQWSSHCIWFSKMPSYLTWSYDFIYKMSLQKRHSKTFKMPLRRKCQCPQTALSFFREIKFNKKRPESTLHFPLYLFLKMSKQTVHVSCEYQNVCRTKQWNTFHYTSITRSFERHIKSQNKGRIFFNTILLKHLSSGETDHRFLERDVKIYIDMISVKQQAIICDTHDY